VSYVETATEVVSEAYAIRLPAVAASQIPTYVTVPHAAVAIGNARRFVFCVAPAVGRSKFDELFVRVTRAYEPPDGSPAVDPVDASVSVAVHSPT